MHPSFPELMHGLFWLIMAIVVLLVGLYAITVLDGIIKSQQQGTIHHDKLIAMADKALADHTAFQREHQAILDRLLGTDRR
jgi:hypothetical protein